MRKCRGRRLIEDRPAFVWLLPVNVERAVRKPWKIKCAEKNKMSSPPSPPAPRIKVHYGAGAEVLPPHLQSFFLWYFTKSLSIKGRQWEEKKRRKTDFFFQNGRWRSAEKKQKQLFILWLKVGQYIKGGLPQKKEGGWKGKTWCFILPMTDGCFLFYFIMHVSAAI